MTTEHNDDLVHWLDLPLDRSKHNDDLVHWLDLPLDRFKHIEDRVIEELSKAKLQVHKLPQLTQIVIDRGEEYFRIYITSWPGYISITEQFQEYSLLFEEDFCLSLKGVELEKFHFEISEIVSPRSRSKTCRVFSRDALIHGLKNDAVEAARKHGLSKLEEEQLKDRLIQEIGSADDSEEVNEKATSFQSPYIKFETTVPWDEDYSNSYMRMMYFMKHGIEMYKKWEEKN